MFWANEEFILVYPLSQVLQTFQDFVAVMKQGNADICFDKKSAMEAMKRLGVGFVAIKCKGKMLEDMSSELREQIAEIEEEENEDDKAW